MVSCDICGKEFKNTQGLRGHKNFVHNDKASSVEQPVAQQATQQLLSSKLSTPVTTEQRLSKLEERFTKLEHITGLRETDERDKLLGITDIPLTKRVTQLTEQLGRLTEQLKSEYVSREAMQNIAAELTGKSESLQKEIANTRSVLTAAMRESRTSYENSFSKTREQSAATANDLYELSKTVKHVQESVQGNRASINQLNTKLASFERMLPEFENKVARVKNLTRRVPTGEIVSIQLSDKREHHFREYKSTAGLSQPRRTSRDLIFGDRWIDLAEPED